MDTQVADLLGGERVLGASVKSNLDLARATRQGLPAETAVQLGDAIIGEVRPRRRRSRGPKIVLQTLDVEVEAIGLTAMGPLGALIGSLRPKVDRKGAGEAKAKASPARLTPEQSDVVIRTARTLAKAIDTLGDREKPRIG